MIAAAAGLVLFSAAFAAYLFLPNLTGLQPLEIWFMIGGPCYFLAAGLLIYGIDTWLLDRDLRRERQAKDALWARMSAPLLMSKR
jgi:high-affinity Fe2+/Pb2+ permease